MGVKFLKVQMIPWCLQLMGNHMISCVHMRGAERAAAAAAAEAEAEAGSSIKLIKWDGVVIYERPINVSQVLVEYPKHLLCRSDCFYIGQKIPALSLSEQLQLGHKYFLLPKHYFQTVLSFVTIASFVSDYNNQPRSTTSNSLLKKAATCQAFDIQRSPSGCLRIRVSDEFISELMEEGNIKHDSKITGSKVCTTPQLLKDFNLLVASRHWKPKLGTIREKVKEKKRKLSSFGMKSRKKSLSERIQKTCPIHKSSDHLLLPTSSKPSSKSKTKIRFRK